MSNATRHKVARTMLRRADSVLHAELQPRWIIAVVPCTVLAVAALLAFACSPHDGKRTHSDRARVATISAVNASTRTKQANAIDLATVPDPFTTDLEPRISQVDKHEMAFGLWNVAYTLYITGKHTEALKPATAACEYYKELGSKYAKESKDCAQLLSCLQTGTNDVVPPSATDSDTTEPDATDEYAAQLDAQQHRRSTTTDPYASVRAQAARLQAALAEASKTSPQLPTEWLTSGRNGTHHIEKVSADGAFLVLDDGSVWKSNDTSESHGWSDSDEVFVHNDQIINLSERNEKIDADCEERACTVIAQTHVRDEFEGSDKPIVLDNEMIFEATTYHYHYAYRPEVIVLATRFRGYLLYRLIIADEIYNATRLR